MLRTSPVFLGLAMAISVALLALLLRFSVNKQQPETLQSKLWNTEELARHNGSDDGLPLLLGILGSVFDVTKGRSHYGPGGGYHHFAGRDASRAFVSGNFTGDGLTDSLHGLSSVDVKSIVDWRGFYFRSYIFDGKLVGRYYDNQGTPTKYLKGVEAKAARGAQLLEKQKIEEAKLPSCNSRWSQQEGGEVWCDTGYPRLVQRPLEMALTGKMSRRCACFKEEQLGQPGLEIYEGCAYQSQVELRVYKDEQEDFPTCKRVQGESKEVKNCIRISRERVEKALQYSYRDRRNKKRDMRSLWIERINAGSHLHGVNYGNFMHGLMKENIQLNRKVLSELSMHEPYSFKSLVDISRVAFPGNKKVPVLPQKEGLSLLV